MNPGPGAQTIDDLLDACIEESERVLHRILDGLFRGVADPDAYRAVELRIIENQVVMMRALRELRGRL